MTLTRRDFMRLLGLGATATAAGIVLPEVEPVRRFWQVGAQLSRGSGFRWSTFADIPADGPVSRGTSQPLAYDDFSRIKWVSEACTSSEAWTETLSSGAKSAAKRESPASGSGGSRERPPTSHRPSQATPLAPHV